MKLNEVRQLVSMLLITAEDFVYDNFANNYEVYVKQGEAGVKFFYERDTQEIA